MQIVSCDDIEWSEVSGHRSGNIEFKRLLMGREGAPDNFELALTRTHGEYTTPRHRHNYDQVRFAMSGKLNYAPGKELRPGEVGYFPEGTYYGPQQVSENPTFLVLQCGGTSGQGFISYDQLRRGHRELAETGEFKNGVFHRQSGSGPETQDGYEAIWEHVQKRRLEYPPARYREPIVMQPEGFSWSGEGAVRNVLGSFTERGTRVEMARLRPGSKLDVEPETAIRLGFVSSGALRCNGEAVEAQAALELDAGEGASIEVETEAQLLWMVLPPISS